MKFIKIKTNLMVYRIGTIFNKDMPISSICTTDCDTCVIENVCASHYHTIKKLK